MGENVLSVVREVSRARQQGVEAIARRQRARFAEMVAFARAESPYYHELYQGLPELVGDPTLLPVTDKKKLMARFDDWGTDRDIAIDKVLPYVEDPDLFGKQLLGRYLVVTTSGTTGTHGIFLIDRRSLIVSAALFWSMLGAWLDTRQALSIIANGGRIALVGAIGTPLATGVGITRFGLRLGGAAKAFSVRTPLPELVAELNRFQPLVLFSYATIAKQLAGEQAAGHLRIKPRLIILTAEGLAANEYSRVALVFGAKVGNLYAASECPFMSYSCRQGWLHVNSDWVVLEPVDADYRPVPPGEQSHTVLISNLANRAQPILRYDLGDSILQRPDPCPCGNPLPPIRVQGRMAEMTIFPGAQGEQVAIPPLVFGGAVYYIPGIERFQMVQTAPARLRVRLRIAEGANADRIWDSVHTELMRLLARHKLDHVTVERAAEPPEQSPGGKYREVIPLR